MKRKRGSLLLLVFVAVFSGCLAETVMQRKPRRGPVPEVGYIETGGGEVRYSLEGWDWFVQGRKHDALRRMKKICRGLDPSVVSEFMRQDADTPYSGADVTDNMSVGLEHYVVSPYRHIVFKCVPPVVSAASTTGGIK